MPSPTQPAHHLRSRASGDNRAVRTSQRNRDRALLAYLGAAHLAGGAAAHEAEDAVREAGRALGHTDVQVHAQLGGIMLSLGEGRPATYESVEAQFRLDQSAQVGVLQAALLAGSLSPDEALRRLSASRAKPRRFPAAGMYVGGLCVALGLAAILQPEWMTVAFVVLAGPFVIALMRLTRRQLIPAPLLPVIVGFTVALGAFLLFDHGLVGSPLRTLLPPVAVLLPGAMIVTGLAELVNGAAVAGMARLAYGAVQLILFTVGVVGAALVTGAPGEALQNVRVDDLGWWSPLVGLVLVTIGIGLLEAIPRHIGPWVFVVLAATMFTQLGAQSMFDHAWAGAFAGATVASALAWAIASTRPALPRMVLFLPSFWLLVPGSLGLVTTTQLGLEPTLSGPTGVLAVTVVVAIALGLVVGTSLGRPIGRLLARR